MVFNCYIYNSIKLLIMRHLLRSLIIPVVLILGYNCHSQTKLFNKTKDSLFVEFNKLYQESVHVHFNKTNYIIGEALGLTAYIIDRENNSPSKVAKNLYCTISDANGNVIKKQLLKVVDGYTSTIFPIDTSFSTGKYTLKAYTNWMRNFDQKNYFVENFNVIKAEDEIPTNESNYNYKLDVQALPEGGHFVHNVKSNVGVIIRDSLDLGVANISGEVYDNANSLVASFKANEMGIGKFQITPNKNKSYYLLLNVDGKKKKYNVKEKIEERGITLSLTRLRKDVLVSLFTNQKTLLDIKDNLYYVGIYNGNILKKVPLRLSNKLATSSKVSFKNLTPGTNIFTLFNKDGEPLAERLFFNYEGLEFLSSKVENVKNIRSDSTRVSLSYETFSKSKFNNLSISILPYETKSYQKNSSIVAQTLIQPFIKGNIENSGYYFYNITPKTIYDLDNLLLTQGWSSYDWETIFTKPQKKLFGFEKGLSVTVQLPKNRRGKSLLFRYSDGSQANIIDLEDGIKSFNSENNYPEESAEFYISNMGKKGRLAPVDLEVTFLPEKIPNLDVTTNNFLNIPLNYRAKKYLDNEILYSSLDNVQQLDAIELEVKLEEQRRSRLETKNFGETYFFDKDNGFKFNSLFGFFRTKGFFVDRAPGTNEVILINLQPSNSLKGQSIVTVFLDDFPLLDLNQLEFFPYQIIDYININKNGFGEGIRGAGGVIRIYTDPYKAAKFGKETNSTFKFPVTFSAKKKFFTPIYKNYDSRFFRDYGAIHWLPNNKIDDNGITNFSFNNYQQESVRVFIEGITDDGKFIFEKKTINLN